LYLILGLTSRNGIGMGDVKLAAPLGLYLGYLGWSQLFYGGALGFVAGGIASVVLVLKNRGNKPKEVAYGPSMLAAGLAVILLMR
jgi:leader peptidase (prepilin peptidase)/N-methyltransferase